MLILAVLLVPVPACAITINDTSYPGYITSPSAYTGVVSIYFQESGQSGSFICSGSLISDMYILTAGHCINDASNWQVNFTTGSGVTTIGVTGSFLDPNFAAYPSNSGLAGLFSYDVGVLQLASAAPADATRYAIQTSYTGVSSSSPIDIVGYGLGGNPSAGILSVGTRRHAQTTFGGVIQSLNGVITPDQPLYSFQEFSTGTPAGIGMINGGDSGGPAFFDGAVIGIADFADLPRTGDYASNTYYLSAWQSLANPAIGDFVDQFAAPEPSTWLLLGSGLIAIVASGRVHRRRIQ